MELLNKSMRRCIEELRMRVLLLLLLLEVQLLLLLLLLCLPSHALVIAPIDSSVTATIQHAHTASVATSRLAKSIHCGDLRTAAGS